MALQYGMSPEVGRDRSSVIAKMVCRPSKRKTSLSSPVPTNWTTKRQADLTMYGIVCWSPLSEPSYVAESWQTSSSDELRNRRHVSENEYFCISDMLSPVMCNLVPRFPPHHFSWCHIFHSHIFSHPHGTLPQQAHGAVQNTRQQHACVQVT